jgi:hypothetical protein
MLPRSVCAILRGSRVGLVLHAYRLYSAFSMLRNTNFVNLCREKDGIAAMPKENALDVGY